MTEDEGRGHRKLRYSVRGRFLQMGALVGLLGFLLFFGIWQPKVQRTFNELEVTLTERQLDVLGNALTPYLLQNQIGAAHEILDHAQMSFSAWRGVELFDGDGRRLYPLEHPDHTKDHYLVTRPILFGGRLVGTLVVHLDIRVHSAALRSQVWHLGVVMMGIVVIFGVGGMVFLDRLVLRRASMLARAAKELAAGRYDTPLPKARQDEIGQLVESFATMRETIRSKEQSLTEARDTAEAAVEAKSRFLATMSHEIRTPLNGILPVTDLLLETEVTEDQLAKLTIIRNAGRTLKSVIDDILDISKLEAGEVLIRAEEFDLDGVVRSAVSVLAPQADARGLSLDVDMGADCAGWVIGDADRLSQVLINLAGNAVKFTDTGGVRVRVSAERGRFRFEVIDTGIGIGEADKARIFKRFYQVAGAQSSRMSGSGLGLSISAALVDAMGGTLRLDSTPGKGSRFHFALPLPEAGHAPDTSIDIHEGAAPTQQPLRVLVVDDSKVNLTVACAMLKRLGHEVDSVTGGAEAVERVAKGGIDLVLMDQHMPEVDGPEATRRIRALRGPVSRVYISGLTASIFAEDVGKCLQAGMDEFLAKPISRIELVRVLKLAQEHRDAEAAQGSNTCPPPLSATQ